MHQIWRPGCPSRWNTAVLVGSHMGRPEGPGSAWCSSRKRWSSNDLKLGSWQYHIHQWGSRSKKTQVPYHRSPSYVKYVILEWIWNEIIGFSVWWKKKKHKHCEKLFINEKVIVAWYLYRCPWLVPKWQQESLVWNRTVNVTGGTGNYLEMDLVNEFCNNSFKGIIKSFGINTSFDT